MPINEIESALNSAEWVFPLFECVHIAGFAVAIGTIALVDFTLLGVGLRREDAPRLLRDTSPWTLLGLTAALTSGPILFLTDADKYLPDKSFRTKITCLVIALAFKYSIHDKVARSGNLGAGKVVASVSLLLWIIVVAGGIFIAYLGSVGV